MLEWVRKWYRGQKFRRQFDLEWLEFLTRFRFVIHGRETRRVYIDFNDLHTDLWKRKFMSYGDMAVIALEDREHDLEEDGCTDIILPIFRARNAVNLCFEKGLVPPGEVIYYVDLWCSGGYTKEVWFREEGNAYKLLFVWEVGKGLTFYGFKLSVGYIEFCPRLEKLCNFDI